ncbi:MAG: RluA family pseudouridine synthase [Polyangiales bacterium]
MSARGAPERIVVVVPGELEGMRLDRALAVLVPDVSRAELARWVEAGRVEVDGAVRPVTKGKVHAGERVVARPMPPPDSDAAPDPTVVFTVLYEDDAIVVIDKPAGLVVHPAKGHATGTLVNGLLARYGAMAPPDVRHGDGPDHARARPGIVHRIDRGTSGVLVVARTAKSREALKTAFAAHDLERVYDALAVGNVPEKITYDTAYGRHPVDRKAFTARPRGPSKRAVTHVVVVERMAKGAVARVECRLETGRTHQIRVHLADHGAPLLGDPLYGKPARDPRVRAIGAALGRQALHARVLGFAHPITRKPLRFEAPWPADFARAVAALRAITS